MRARILGYFIPALALLSSCAEPGALSSFHEPGASIQNRPDTPGNTRMFAFDSTEVVETFPSVGGHFLVHYTRAGKDAVPATDNDSSGIPDFVEMVGKTYESVLTHYQSIGFNPPVSDAAIPDNGGDDRFDVYLVDFAGQGDGNYQNDVCTGDVCAGFMIQENDFKGYNYPSLQIAVNILASHEFFHAIQAGYDSKQGSILAEGTAVWGTETYDSTLTDFEGFIPGYFDNTDRPLDQPINGASDPFSYGTCIYWWFLEERYGAGMIRGLWESTKNGANGIADPQWFQILDGYLQTKTGSGFGDAFTEFATWNLFTGKHADASRSYKAGTGYPEVQMTDETAPYSEKALRVYYGSSQYYRLSPGSRGAMTAAFVAADPSDLDGLTVLFGVDRKNVYDPITKVTDLKNIKNVDVSGADHFVVVVVNTLQAGDSKRPGFCVGSPEEVAACVQEIQGAGGAGGGGGAQPTSTSSGSEKPSTDKGCSCSVSEPDESLVGPYALCAALGIALAARRRR